MKTLTDRFVRVVTALSCIVSAAAQSPAGGTRAPIVPLTPAHLLTYLPSTPPRWALAASRAESYYTSWLHTRAEREFRYTPPAQPDGAKSPVQITKITLLDTGYAPGAFGDFEDFKPGRYGSEESLVIAGMPARHSPLGKNGERVRVAVNRRFIVQFDLFDQAPNTATNWARAFDFQRLAGLQPTGATSLPKPIPIVHVDELNAANNSNSYLFW